MKLPVFTQPIVNARQEQPASTLKDNTTNISPSECGCGRRRECVGPCVMGSCLGTCVPNVFG